MKAGILFETFLDRGVKKLHRITVVTDDNGKLVTAKGVIVPFKR